MGSHRPLVNSGKMLNRWQICRGTVRRIADCACASPGMGVCHGFRNSRPPEVACECLTAKADTFSQSAAIARQGRRRTHVTLAEAVAHFQGKTFGIVFALQGKPAGILSSGFAPRILMSVVPNFL